MFMNGNGGGSLPGKERKPSPKPLITQWKTLNSLIFILMEQFCLSKFVDMDSF